MMVKTIKRMICGRFITVEIVQLPTEPSSSREKLRSQFRPSLMALLINESISGGISSMCRPPPSVHCCTHALASLTQPGTAAMSERVSSTSRAPIRNRMTEITPYITTTAMRLARRGGSLILRNRFSRRRATG